MSWRPEDWSNPYEREPDILEGHPTYQEERAFEEGADAMLEALKQMGVRTNIYPVPVSRKADSAILAPLEGLIYAYMPTEGCLVFIPEEAT